jgi:excisionase family DNA binding protein
MLIPALAPGPGEGGDEILTRAEVARLFRVKPSTVTRWAQIGRLRSFRMVGGHRRYYVSEVTAFLIDASRTPQQPAAAKDPR